MNATGWAQAVTSGMLQRAGGSFPLLADVDFGASFGLKSIYYKSRSANIASTGTLRLASADSGVAFRNNANNADLALTTDASDNLLYNGNVIAASASGTVPVSRGGTGDISLSAYSVLLGGTTSTNPVQTVSGVGLSGQSLVSNGPGMIPSWQTVTGTGTVNSGTGGQLAYYAVTGSAVSGNPNLLYTESAGSTFLRLTDTSLSGILLDMTGHEIEMAIGAGGDFTVIDTTNARTIFHYQPASNTVLTTGAWSLASPTLSGSITASGALATPLSMGSNKVTNLANGTAAQDAAAFGQLTVNYQATQVGSQTGGTNVTSRTITTTGGPVLILASGVVTGTPSGGVINAHLFVLRGVTGVNGTDGSFLLQGVSNSTQEVPVSITAVDVVAAGTYTYNLNFLGVTGSTFSVSPYSLVLIELHS